MFEAREEKAKEYMLVHSRKVLLYINFTFLNHVKDYKIKKMIRLYSFRQ